MVQSLTPREELLNLQKKIYRRQKKLIEESVLHQDRSFKAYEGRYLRVIKKYLRVATPEEVQAKIREAEIIYVGDYHTLNQSQKSMLRLLRAYVKVEKNFCIAFEVIQSGHQKILDQFMRGTLTDRTFLKKIGFKEHWFFDLWENFKPLFDFARHHGILVYGIEAKAQSGASLKKRDEASAKTIVEIFKKNPQQKIFVFVGDLHIAPAHLPHQVEDLLKKENILATKLVLYQNSDALYWKLAEREMEDATLVVKISGDEYCRMHTAPIICQQSYLNWLEHEEGILDYADAKHTFLGYLEQIAGFLDIRLGREKDEVEVFTCGDLSFLKKLRESKVFSRKEIADIKRQILQSESYTIPKMKYVYLANVSVNHAAEEASHTLKFLCSGEEFPRGMQDAFYALILHEALGFFGSKIINHRRKCLRPASAKALIAYLQSSSVRSLRHLEYQTAKLFLEHERRLTIARAFHHNKIASLSQDLFLSLTHAIGYYLGEKMFYGLLTEKMDKPAIRELYGDAMEEEGEPVLRYFDLVARLKGVILPRRL